LETFGLIVVVIIVRLSVPSAACLHRGILFIIIIFNPATGLVAFGVLVG